MKLRKVFCNNCNLWLLLSGLILLTTATAQTNPVKPDDQALVNELRKGGYNIYFRHAATDWSQSDQISKADDWTSCDPRQVRQLSDSGRETSSAIGKAIKALQIPIAEVFASPYCRTVETARLMQLAEVQTTTDIMNMRVAQYFGGREAIAETTRRRLSTTPASNGNNVFVAHGNVLVTATEVYPQEAEAVVFQPHDEEGYKVVARISPQRWTQLAEQFAILR